MTRPGDSDALEAAYAMRRAVLGYVDAQTAGADLAAAELQAVRADQQGE